MPSHNPISIAQSALVAKHRSTDAHLKDPQHSQRSQSLSNKIIDPSIHQLLHIEAPRAKSATQLDKSLVARGGSAPARQVRQAAATETATTIGRQNRTKGLALGLQTIANEE